MNLWFRMLWLWLAGGSRSAVPALGPCVTPFRVGLLDLDLFRHLNNGRYFTIMDLARVDMMRRSGLLAKLNAAGFFPVVVTEAMVFRKSHNWRQRFDIETEVVAWDEKSLTVTQRFLVGRDEYATALVRARFLRRSGGSVPTAEIIAWSGEALTHPPMDAGLTAWIAQFDAGIPVPPRS